MHVTCLSILIQNEGGIMSNGISRVNASIILKGINRFNSSIIQFIVHNIKCWHYPHALTMWMRCYQNYTRIILISDQDFTGASLAIKHHQEGCHTRSTLTSYSKMPALLNLAIYTLDVGIYPYIYQLERCHVFLNNNAPTTCKK